MDDLKSRGCHKLKRGNTAVPIYMNVARFTCVVPLPLLLCRCCTVQMLLKFSSKLVSVVAGERGAITGR